MGTVDVTPEGRLLKKMDAPPVFTTTSMKELAEEPLLPPKVIFPMAATFTYARKDKRGRKMPQAIAHRGYKAKFPENTMAAFTAAVDAGAHAIETDIHLSKDGIVVLSHDEDLKRCFGKSEKIIDCDWEYLSKLRTAKEPPEPMPLLVDLLKYLTKPGLEDLWVLLDIKLDNKADDVMRLIAEAIRSVPPASSHQWKDRVVLGCWATKYLPLCDQYLPDFPISHIGLSTIYARQFFAVPNVSFNILQAVLMGPLGASFRKKAKSLNRPLFAWTVNIERRMRWCIKHELDGVITDDPKKFREICDEWEGDRVSLTLWDMLDVLRINLFALLFMFMFKWRNGQVIEQRFVGLRRRRTPAIES